MTDHKMAEERGYTIPSWTEHGKRPFAADDLLAGPPCRIVSVDTKGPRRLVVVMCIDDHPELQEMEYPIDFLRLYCECSKCFDRISHVHLGSDFDMQLESASVQDLSIEDNGNGLKLFFAEDHPSYFPALWLYRRRLTSEGITKRLNSIYFFKGHQVPWEDNFRPQYGSLQEMSETPEGFVTFGEAMMRDGIYMVSDSPDRKLFPYEFFERTGLVPFFSPYGGGRFEVENVPSSSAYAKARLTMHVDQPSLDYHPRVSMSHSREPPPWSALVQMLHCIVPADEGGENVMSDGKKGALLLRERHPDMYKILIKKKADFEDVFPSQTSVCLHEAFYANRSPVINLDDDGDPAYIMWNSGLRSSYYNDTPENFDEWYEAVGTLIRIIDTECSITFKLRAGDIMIFDNTRVLHARTAFNKSSRRCLEAGYTDWDHVYSRLRVAKILTAQNKEVSTKEQTE